MVNCLLNIGFRPWRIAPLEAAVHSIPGIGVFTAIGAWTYRDDQIKDINMRVLQKSQERPRRIEPPVVEDEDPTTEPDEPSPDYIEMEERCISLEKEEEVINELRLEQQELMARKANAQALCVLNLALIGMLGLTLYGLGMYHRI